MAAKAAWLSLLFPCIQRHSFILSLQNVTFFQSNNDRCLSWHRCRDYFLHFTIMFCHISATQLRESQLSSHWKTTENDAVHQISILGLDKNGELRGKQGRKVGQQLLKSIWKKMKHMPNNSSVGLKNASHRYLLVALGQMVNLKKWLKFETSYFLLVAWRNSHKELWRRAAWETSHWWIIWIRLWWFWNLAAETWCTERWKKGLMGRVECEEDSIDESQDCSALASAPAAEDNLPAWKPPTGNTEWWIS